MIPTFCRTATTTFPAVPFGSLITGTFDLTGSVSADKPTLYFNYFLDTENAQSNNNNDMRDSARVWVWGTLNDTYTESTQGGGSGSYAATPVLDSPGDDNAFRIVATVPGATYSGYPLNGIPVSFINSPGTPTAVWDTSSGLVVTYEWGVTTAGELVQVINNNTPGYLPFHATLVDPEPNGSANPNGDGAVQFGLGWHLLATNNSRDNDDELPRFLSMSWDDSSDPRQRVQHLFDADDWRQARVDLGQFAGQTGLKLRFDFSTAGRLASDEPHLQMPVSWGGTPENHGDFTDPERGQNNDHEGFYIDDIIIGYAERGEMVTGGQRQPGPLRGAPKMKLPPIPTNCSSANTSWRFGGAPNTPTTPIRCLATSHSVNTSTRTTASSPSRVLSTGPLAILPMVCRTMSGRSAATRTSNASRIN